MTGVTSPTLWAAQSFTTDGSSYELVSIETLLGLRSGAPAVVAELRADGGAGVVGATLGTFGFGPVGAGAPSAMVLTPTTSLLLAPATTYWLVFGVSGGGADSFGWSYAEGNAYTGPGTIGAYAYSTDGGGAWPAVGTDNPYQIEVTVRATSTVPEPGALSLVVLGAGALAVARRRRARTRARA